MNRVVHLPPPESTTLRDGNLTLRPLCADDVPALWHAGQSEDIGHYTSIEWPFTLDAARDMVDDASRAWHAGTAARFAIIDTTDAHRTLFAGTASLLHIYPDRRDAELGYWLGLEGRGRGLARRSVGLLCSWGFKTLRLCRLHLGVDFDNDASHAVAKANGFVATVEEMWHHPTDPSKDAVILMYERWAPNRTG